MLRTFAQAAADLHAASLTGNHLHRRRALVRAADRLHAFQADVAARRRPDPLARRLLQTAEQWLTVIAALRTALAEQEAEHPQIPEAFVAGPPLTSADEELFKGRRDLAAILDHDLASAQRAPLVLTGQRRMGKSSLLHMLPAWLGSGTTVVTLNFLGLSGVQQRSGRLDLLLAEAVRDALPDAPPAPPANGWSGTLSWLRELDACLRAKDDRVLIAVDEVERLQDGIDQGWATTDFLDLVRAAGDSLTRIRVLLVSAYPLDRIGPAWPDRLVSAMQRRIAYLDPPDAEELLRRPVEGFPDIYPDGGVERILHETRCHPFLLQHVGAALCRRLNVAERPHATHDDIEAAFDDAITNAQVFDELWRRRTDAERALLERLVRGADPDRARDALHALKREGLVEQREGRWCVAVPLFAAWIADRHGDV